MDFDTRLMPVRWRVGLSSAADIEALFGTPHRDALTAGGRTTTYDLYIEASDRSNGSPPSSYVVRDAADPERPSECKFPYTPVWPSEALQVEFIFDAAGILAGFEFKVGERIS